MTLRMNFLMSKIKISCGCVQRKAVSYIDPRRCHPECNDKYSNPLRVKLHVKNREGKGYTKLN